MGAAGVGEAGEDPADAAGLAIGAAAAGQRGYFDSFTTTCSNGATIAVTTAAGPVNYLGVSPKVACSVPKPSSCGPRSAIYSA